jgi:D-alanyl-D-alanine carboxypeptidase
MVRFGLFMAAMLLFAVRAVAAPYAALVMDMRTGEVLHSANADTQLHPASLTKMMTLYIAFEAIEHGEITLDTMVTISANAAAEPPSKLGLRAGQKIALRHLIRAAAVKSANDAATAIGEAISGSEAAFARRMNRTAQAMGMTRTHFKNANGLTEAGHMSTARDMTILGRHVFFDYPAYYNLFSRRSADVGGHTVYNTNRRFLDSYTGADGIKTGYTRAAGFNLVASAERGSERIIAAVFGGQSTASRNAKMAELLDLGFRNAPTTAALRKPAKPPYRGNPEGAEGPMIASSGDPAAPGAAGKTIRIVVAPTRSIRPRPRPAPQAPPVELVLAIESGINEVVADVLTAEADVDVPAVTPPPRPETPDVAPAVVAVAPAATPEPRPEPVPEPAAEIILAELQPEIAAPPARPEVVTRMSTSGGRHWGITIGRYSSEYEAERVLLKTALTELATLGEALRKVVRGPRGFDANFVGLTQEGAELACRRLAARSASCTVIGPAS